MSIERALSFPAEEYEDRVARAKKEISKRGLDALLIHDLPNICYLCGYESWNTHGYYALLVPRQGPLCLVLWRSEQGNAKLSSWVEDYETFPTGVDPIDTTIEMLRKRGFDRGRVGMELLTSYLTPGAYQRLIRGLPGMEAVDCSGLVPRLRLLKSRREQEVIRRAARMTDAGMRAALKTIGEGVSDQEIAAAASQTLLAEGSEYMCIQPVVCAGTLAGVPHANHRGVRMKKGDTVLLELSGCVHRYSAPLMRSAVVGDVPEKVRRMEDAISNTLRHVMDAMRPGAELAEIARTAEPLIAQAGEDAMALFHHTYAYSVGLGFMPNWADAPVTITERSEGVLEPGMVFHLPISLRVPGQYGVALSETVIVTEDGCEAVTHVERKLHRA